MNIRRTYPGKEYMGGASGTFVDLSKLEYKVVEADLATKDDRSTLLELKRLGVVRNKAVARTWTADTWQFDVVAARGGAVWARCVTQVVCAAVYEGRVGYPSTFHLFYGYVCVFNSLLESGMEVLLSADA